MAAVAADQYSELEKLKTKKKSVVIPPVATQKTSDLVMSFLKKNCPSAPIMQQLSVKESMSLFHLMIHFIRTTLVQDHNPKNFKAFCTGYMTDQKCASAARATISQSESSLWFDVKYARVSASKLWEASRCQTDGSLKNQMFGVVKIKATEAMLRGLRLETSVLRSLRKTFGKMPKRTGFVMKGSMPIFGASPDALLGDYVIEIKCPMTDKTFPSYFNDDFTEPAKKYKGQINLQMKMCDKKKGLFCVADPDFIKNNKLTILVVNLDTDFLETVMDDADNYWDIYIYPVLYKAAAKTA